MEIGDKVKCINDRDGVPVEQIGIVTGINGPLITVQWENYTMRGHEGNIGDATHSCWNVDISTLQIIETTPPAPAFQFKQEKVDPRYLESYLKHQSEKSWTYVMHIKSRQKNKILVFLKKEIPAPSA